MDAFVQRCRDLIEVCNCQIHFARWGDGEKTKMPVLGGQRGPEIARSLLEIEETFNKNLTILIRVEKVSLAVSFIFKVVVYSTSPSFDDCKRPF